jgi:formylmethanofuran dehydrogenase subunit E
VEWFAAVLCQVCGENVYEQRLYPADGVLVWQCSKGHKSFMENYTAF